MPTRTELPTISMTSTTMSSPTMMRSPARRVMMSTVLPPWKSAVNRLDVQRRLGRRLDHVTGEQRGAHGGVARLVDHLMAAAVCDQDRRAEVRTEVRGGRTGADRHPDVRVLGAHALGVGVGQLDGSPTSTRTRARPRARR